MKFLTTVFLVLSYLGLAHADSVKTTFAPENSMQIPMNMFSSTTVTEEDFNRILDRVDEVYQPVIAARGKTLQVQRSWEDSTVNAYAQQIGNVWLIRMFGGLARHPDMTPDGFAMVACHEMAHHIGGAPKRGWASIEGQSDYYASLKCMRELFGEEDNSRLLEKSAQINPLLQDKCIAAHQDAANQALCVRSSLAGLSLGAVLANLGRSPAPRPETPDGRVVTRTSGSHPAAQCRLDTYLAGALCAADLSTEVSDSDPNIGSCSRKFGDTIGVRPLCWFKPDVNLNFASVGL